KAPDYGTFQDRSVARPRLLLAGGITAGIGVALGVAGTVRWVLLARKGGGSTGHGPPQGRWTRMRAAPWADGRRAGVVFSGRF
ncbi:MAG: hypothetical protein AB1Z98_20540, partial [Nannocystaceae bacterium]